MAIKHADVKATGDKGYASEWNKDHTIEDATITTAKISQDDDMSMNTHKITDVTDPTGDQDVATKKYVDDNVPTIGNNQCIVRRTNNQSIPNASPTAIQFTTEDYDPAGMHDNSTNPDRITVPVAGVYLINASVSWVNNWTTDWDIQVTVNGADKKTLYLTGYDRSAEGGDITMVCKLSANDIVRINVEQYSGGAINLRYAWCEVCKIS